MALPDVGNCSKELPPLSHDEIVRGDPVVAVARMCYSLATVEDVEEATPVSERLRAIEKQIDMAMKMARADVYRSLQETAGAKAALLEEAARS